jgi:hypothetical protein
MTLRRRQEQSRSIDRQLLGDRPQKLCQLQKVKSLIQHSKQTIQTIRHGSACMHDHSTAILIPITTTATMQKFIAKKEHKIHL